LFEFQHETFNAPLRSGFWRWVRRDDIHVLKVACPLCGTEGDLEEGKHEVDYDGTVSPSLICPGDSCDWHDHAKLQNYDAP